MALPGESGEGESYTVSLSSVEETEALGGLLASLSKRGDVIFLHGELGAGKTALSRGFLRYFFLNSELDVPSPTYLLHFVYQQDAPTEAKMITEETVTDGGEGAEVDTATTSVSVSSTKQATSVDSASQKEEKKIVFKASRFAHIPDCAVHHLDPYRLAVGKIAALVDFETMFRDEISLIEWPERLGKEIAVPAERLLHVHLSGVGVQAENRKAKIVFGSTTSDTFGEQQVLNVKSATSKTSSTLEDQHSSASTTPVSCTWSPRLANLIDAERDGQKQNTDAKERSLSEALERFRTKEAAWIFGEGELTPETSASSALNDSNAFTTTRAAEHLRGQHQKEGEKKSKMKSATSLPSSLLDESGKRLQRPLVVLGIESSCDDTGCAIVTSDGRILGECVASQAGIHEAWGGVKPDAAQKAHRDAIHETVETCIERAKAACGVQHQTTSSEKDASTSSSASTPSNEKDTSSSSVKTAPEFSSLADIDAVAVTVGPGLGLCLSVGVEKAVTLATELQKPLVRIHHMEAHAMMTRMPLKKDVEIPDFVSDFVSVWRPQHGCVNGRSRPAPYFGQHAG
ncbi:unnamed protein product [Amoebophrya sp. A25]|nr:unnamed protein product [Amoebophrya sp. A25]|eukprot:GSA25T00002846001.1